MKKRIVSAVMALILCLTLLPTAALAADGAWDGSIATAFAGGSGTESDPYQIANGAELAYLASSVNSGETYTGKNFVLTANIDLNGLPWTPIGNSFSDALLEGSNYRIFAGNFDGNGYTISNVSIGSETAPLEADVFGLFGATAGKISNLNLDTVSIHGIAKIASIGAVIGFAGGLVGYSGGYIENCHVTGLTMDMSAPSNVYAAAYCVGGLVGVLDETQLINECSVSGSITEKAGKGSIGGLIGELGKAAKITYSRSDVTVNVKADSRGGANVGGFIGKGNGKTDAERIIRNCYATGNVTGGAYTGGFAGGLWGLNIKNCYASGNVSQAAAAMASFVGTDASDPNYYGSITSCFAIGSVTGSSPFRYAFAMQDATKRSEITNCYFAEENSSIKNQNESAAAKPQEEMKTEDFAAALNNGDNSNGWSFVNGQVLCGAEPADYSAVDAALDKIPADLTAYTDESIKTLSAAAEAVIRGKVIAKQAEVDAMAAAIERAISDLVFKPADYTAVDAAIAKANALNENDYIDFSAVKAALEAVVRGKNITEQFEVDAMAKAIEDAIAALVEKPSSGGGFSSGSFFPSYPVNTPDKTENGTVTVSTKNATSGSTVTITVKPDDGFKLDELTVIDKNGNELKLTDKGNGKYTFTMPASKVEINAAFVKKVEISPFSDVSTSAYYYEAVKWAQEKGITGGIGNGLFGPNQPCTRAQIVTFLWRAAGSPVVNYAMNMSDVPEGSYYAEAVRWALSEGITTGTTENTFSPDSECTRAQAVAFLFRYAASEAVTLQELVSGFSDADSVPGYALPAMNWALAEEIVQGNGSKLMPNDSCTRAQIVTFLFRAYQDK
ncbi:MAG: S-layer homology domain-containing protein [Oscillospiraceae bacterium]